MKHLTKTQRKHHAARSQRKNAKRVAIKAQRDLDLKRKTIKQIARLKAQFDEVQAAMKANEGKDTVEGLPEQGVDELGVEMSKLNALMAKIESEMPSAGDGNDGQQEQSRENPPVIDAVIEE